MFAWKMSPARTSSTARATMRSYSARVMSASRPVMDARSAACVPLRARAPMSAASRAASAPLPSPCADRPHAHCCPSSSSRNSSDGPQRTSVASGQPSEGARWRGMARGSNAAPSSYESATIHVPPSLAACSTARSASSAVCAAMVRSGCASIDQRPHRASAVDVTSAASGRPSGQCRSASTGDMWPSSVCMRANAADNAAAGS